VRSVIAAPEQHDLQLRLELANLLAQCGLGDLERGCRTTKALRLGERDEIAKMPQLDAHRPGPTPTSELLAAPPPTTDTTSNSDAIRSRLPVLRFISSDVLPLTDYGKTWHRSNN
jgi:hypothetical protein